MEIKLKHSNHFKAFKKGLDEVKAEAYLNMQTFYLEVHFGTFSQTFYPQYIVYVDGDKRYSPIYDENAKTFIGWRPYFNKSVQSFVKKLDVKELLSSNNILVPEFSQDNDHDFGDFIIKGDISSFGDTIKGPFKEASDYSINAEKGEYAEKLINGDAIKIWAWNNTPVCLEYLKWPRIMGDGEKTVRELVKIHIKLLDKEPEKKPKVDQALKMLEFYDRNLDTVLEKGEEHILDFIYGSDFTDKDAITDVYLGKADSPEWSQQIQPIVDVLWAKACEEGVGDLAYSIDAILDKEQKLWILEANSNPFMHPAMYEHMIKTSDSKQHLVSIVESEMA